MKRLILVVDDERLIVDTLVEVLTWEGHEVIHAGNGAQALERIADRIPDLLLIDFMMPVKDGVSTIDELRANDRTAELPIVLMTAAPMSVPSSARHDQLLTKPFNVAQLRTILAKAFSRGER